MRIGLPMNAKKSLTALAALAVCASALAAAVPSAGAADLKRLYDPMVKRVSQNHGVPEDLIHSVIRAESNYDKFAISDAGAMGLMQLMPATAVQYGVGNVFDPAQNIEGGTKYLKDLIRLYQGETVRVLAAYNAGQEAVRKYNGVPPYKETRDYIARILASYKGTGTKIRKKLYRMIDDSGTPVLTDDPNYNQRKKLG
jgi:soluble lytic murein transglycosylase-like protein